MKAHLILRLEAPLMSFGAEAIDNRGVVQDFPALSMVTGLLGNALGWRRGHDAARLQRLQGRLVMAARLDRPGSRLTDFQTAQLAKDDKGWTTRNRPEGRGGGDETYRSPHLRYRDHAADGLCIVALRLEPSGESPTLDDLEEALERPARPLFIGRKPCLPSAPILVGRVEADDVLAALRTLPWQGEASATRRERRRPPGRAPATWPEGEGNARGVAVTVTDERNWHASVHGGARATRRGEIELVGAAP
ncbi:type I-E CRISPR-associated protein Cas5/CasD [Benzoatithermus flavus]|uniref:Type I-E CRISPR-associated protein Cas5/CasD n=1 Tax=Benzoatithermus flavus TaxID=3108223 RepID=A0ABU8XMK2_9PROT